MFCVVGLTRGLGLCTQYWGSFVYRLSVDVQDMYTPERACCVLCSLGRTR